MKNSPTNSRQTSRCPITTHVLDLSTGLPASDIHVRLDELRHNVFQPIAKSKTNGDGRVEDLLPVSQEISTGTYKLIFITGEYFKSRGETSFYPTVEITFNITDATRHHHVPLLLSPFGYSTYRGS